jgi:hypothetical protein
MKISINQIFFVLCIGTLISCKSKSNNYSTLSSSAASAIQYKTINLDTLKLDSVHTSFVGDIQISKNNLYYIDRKFCYVFKFNPQGKYINRYLGQGNAKNELPIKNITMSAFLPNGNSLFLGTNWDVFIFDTNFKKLDDYDINWHSRASKEQMASNPDPEKMYMYSFLYFGNMVATNTKLYFPVASQHAKFNPTIASYGKETRILGEMEIANGYVDKVFGRLSPLYHNNLNTLVFGYAMVDLRTDKDLLVAFPADPFMYIADGDFVLSKKFGSEGREMNTKYVNVNDTRMFHQNYKQETSKKGYYTFIKYVPETQTLFRGYHKNGQSATDGLQVYMDDVLIADVDVPVNFRVSGFIAPYYYSNSFSNEDTEEIKLYRFMLK